MVPTAISVLLAFAPLAADPTPDPVALVKQLGSEDFAEREAAAKALTNLGARAEPALKAGLKTENAEVRARAAQLLVAIRKDALGALAKTFDPAGTDEPDHPVWKRYKAIAGTDDPARRLFAEMIRDPRRRWFLLAVEQNPDSAGKVYEQHVAEINTNLERGRERREQVQRHFQKLLRPNPVQALEIPAFPPKDKEEKPASFDRVLYLGSGRVVDPDDPTPKPADLAVAFYLGTFPASAKALPFAQWEEWPSHIFPEREMLLAEAFDAGLDHPYHRTPANVTVAPAFRRLFAGWLAGRGNPGSLCMGLVQGRKVPETLPTARAVLSEAKNPLKLRLESVSVVVAFGDAKDEPLVAPLLADKTVVASGKYGPAQKEAKAQVRDVALAALLALRGKDPGDFGFPGLEFHRVGPLKTLPTCPESLGFYDDASRAAAHKKAKAWLDEQKK